MIARLMALKPAWILAGVIALSSVVTTLAMRRTSTTFDEIVLISAGARGYTNGKFDLAPDHPPVMQYLYGLPVFLTKPHYPSEKGYDTHDTGYRYLYARQFFWESGNDPERAAFLGRIPAVLIAALLGLLTYSFAKRAIGVGGGLLAATMVAFLPDVLAHGGVAYNDVPLALLYFGAVWMIDRMLRNPSWRNAALAGAAVGLAFGVKISAVAIGPAAVALTVIEAIRRGRDVRWIVRVLPAIVISLIAAYVALVIIYRGDFMLEQFRYALGYTFKHVTKGHGASGFILGKANPQGFWYFFPLAFFFKTSIALHVLLLIAVMALLKADFPKWRELLAHPLRVPVIAAGVFGAILLTSSLNIGFRYALPVLPHVCVLIAAGVAHMWRIGTQRMRVLIAGLALWLVLGPLSWYPNFLAYISEYGPGRDRGSEVLVDSSLDWGQGLLQLRDYMREHDIKRIYLSYFGSARPDGYGIDYVPLYSFFPLATSALSKPDAPEPTHLVISATNLQGVYFRGDPFGPFRHERVQIGDRKYDLEAVVAHNMYIYRINP
ncbi:MAG TPA: glycosyltransferase family 39 protein [Longimicrobiales bacterium]|nr:glycosyltransferase family 39 protein [Longimicrobiales bacterium]